MPQFKFHQDIKCSIWFRSQFSVEAESYEEAVAKVAPHKDIDIFDEGPQDFLRGSCELKNDSLAPIYPDENGGNATLEIYNDKDEELFNNKIQQ